MSGDTTWRSDGDAWAEAGIRGAVVVAHGGKSVSAEPTSRHELAVLRMVPLANAIRRTLRGYGVMVSQPRFVVQGWNGELASPVADLNRLLDEIGTRYGDIPVVLIGHSMGARAAFRGGGKPTTRPGAGVGDHGRGARAAFRVPAHPAVTAVAGLAPWLPPGEPVGQLAGRRVLLVHGTADRVTPPAQTWAYAERARPVTGVAAIEIRSGEHTMLWRAPLWHRLAAEFSRLSLGLPGKAEEVTKAFQEATAGDQRTMA
jgi:pimeloyl-ACP methyl ester carboxylesterase